MQDEQELTVNISITLRKSEIRDVFNRNGYKLPVKWEDIAVDLIELSEDYLNDKLVEYVEGEWFSDFMQHNNDSEEYKIVTNAPNIFEEVVVADEQRQFFPVIVEKVGIAYWHVQDSQGFWYEVDEQDTNGNWIGVFLDNGV